jgi:hypothetical protein
MTQLPTRTDIFVNTQDALSTASSALSEARDWIRSDWSPIGSELTTQAAKARTSTLDSIGKAKAAIEAAKRDIAAAIDSLVDPSSRANEAE